MQQGPISKQQQLFLQHQYARTLSRATASHLQHQHQHQMIHRPTNQPAFNSYRDTGTMRRNTRAHKTRNSSSSRPLCRCRVMYMGSSVPHVTKNGLHGIQEPLHHLYPEERFSSSSQQQSIKPPILGDSLSSQQTIDISHLSAGLGIDSWLSVWSNGLLLENVDELGRQVKRFFPIESLHYCAAVRFFDTCQLGPTSEALNSSSARPPPSDHNNNSLPAAPASTVAPRGRFLPLDAPIFRWPSMLDASHPPVFAAIFRRTCGVKVLECHAFICRRDAAANALVRCCTHAYGDLLNARRLSIEMPAMVPPAPPLVHPIPNTGLSPSRQESRIETPVSEDNYAVISQTRVEVPSPEPPKQLHDMEPSNPVAEGLTKEKQRKGSSRSLFPDFSPEPVTTNEKLSPVERLSQSLERLQLNPRSTCCPEPEIGEQSEKRLSKSMQNLLAEKPVGAACHRRISGIAKRSSHHRKHHHSSSRELERRFASVHELQCQPLSPVAIQDGSSEVPEGRLKESRLSNAAESAAPEPELGPVSCQASRCASYYDAPAVLEGSSSVSRHERRQRRTRGAPLQPLPAPLNQKQQQQQQYLHPHQLYMRPLYAPAPYPPYPPMLPPAHLLDPSTAALMLAHMTQPHHPQLPGYGPARFRCLSPPAALLAESPTSPSQVVSGHPGFLRQQQQQQASGARRNENKPNKLSWIKRLSLTISAAGSTSALSEQHASPGSGPGQPKKRRSSLFALTGTLGRPGGSTAACQC